MHVSVDHSFCGSQLCIALWCFLAVDHFCSICSMKVSEKEEVVQSGTMSCDMYISFQSWNISMLFTSSSNAMGEILYGKIQRNSSVCSAVTVSTFQSSQEAHLHKINYFQAGSWKMWNIKKALKCNTHNKCCIMHGKYSWLNWIKFSSVQFTFIKVSRQQPGGQLHKQHNIQTQITKDNKQDTYETNTNKENTILKSLFTHYNN
jgi:hypothetical protein